ncbi:MAG: protein kinase [Deltaproteobacteria bacterium]|jgi:serine/threonine-protein kinase|nr:protein kinase [Deltaproteobacteria bacterium]MBW2531041.1 protein kinase [Deltaproteobacteria bacterium]
MKLCPSCRNGFYGTPEVCPVCAADLSDDEEVTGHELVGMAVGDRYELTELLGEGAMGWVYRGVHKALERSVAIKLLKTTGEAQHEQVTRFEQEARAISRLHHPHIVSVIDFGRTPGGMFYLVTEFLEGNNLADLMAEEELLPVGRVISIFHQILAAVEEAHGNQVIHRDLKPENIAITPLRSGDDFVKVLDFGIAMVSDERRPRMTAQGATVGTPGFMAPETIMEGAATERSDIYALGNILYEMLTGMPPFDHEWPMALLSLHLNEQPLSITDATPERNYPPELERVVSRAMAKDPADRYGSIAEFRADLLEATNQIGQVELECQRCSRPRDPTTGLCSLHGRPSMLPPAPAPFDTGPPQSTPSPVPSSPPVDTASGTLIQQAALNRVALVDRVRGDEAVGRRREAEALVDFLLGSAPMLELAGNPGIGKRHLLRGLSRGAESVGLRVLRMQPDPQRALRPWYPVRQVVGELLDCGAEPRSRDRMSSSARQLGIAAEHLSGLSLLFGFSHPDGPAQWFERAKTIRRAAAAVLASAGDEAPGICVVAEDVLEYDRASQSFVRSLPRRLGSPLSKLCVTSDGAFWPKREDRVLLRPSRLEPTDVAELIDRAGLGDYADKATLAARIAEVSDGNPYHARQAILAHGEGRALDGTLAELLTRRLSTLPDDARQMLQTVCALGREVPLQMLDGLVDDSVTLLATDLLVRRGFLVADSDRSLSPAHPATAWAVLEGMPHRELVATHRAIADRLKQTGASVFVRAHHAYEADGAEDALELLTAAGDEACRWSDVETAALVHYRRAAHVARWHLLWSETDSNYLELALKMGSALRASGHTRAAEVVFKEVLGSATHHPTLRDRAEESLQTLHAR